MYHKHRRTEVMEEYTREKKTFDIWRYLPTTTFKIMASYLDAYNQNKAIPQVCHSWRSNMQNVLGVLLYQCECYPIYEEQKKWHLSRRSPVYNRSPTLGMTNRHSRDSEELLKFENDHSTAISSALSRIQLIVNSGKIYTIHVVPGPNGKEVLHSFSTRNQRYMQIPQHHYLPPPVSPATLATKNGMVNVHTLVIQTSDMNMMRYCKVAHCRCVSAIAKLTLPGLQHIYQWNSNNMFFYSSSIYHQMMEKFAPSLVTCHFEAARGDETHLIDSLRKDKEKKKKTLSQLKPRYEQLKTLVVSNVFLLAKLLCDNSIPNIRHIEIHCDPLLQKPHGFDTMERVITNYLVLRPPKHNGKMFRIHFKWNGCGQCSPLSERNDRIFGNYGRVIDYFSQWLHIPKTQLSTECLSCTMTITKNTYILYNMHLGQYPVRSEFEVIRTTNVIACLKSFRKSKRSSASAVEKKEDDDVNGSHSSEATVEKKEDDGSPSKVSSEATVENKENDDKRSHSCVSAKPSNPSKKLMSGCTLSDDYNWRGMSLVPIHLGALDSHLYSTEKPPHPISIVPSINMLSRSTGEEFVCDTKYPNERDLNARYPICICCINSKCARPINYTDDSSQSIPAIVWSQRFESVRGLPEDLVTYIEKTTHEKAEIAHMFPWPCVPKLIMGFQEYVTSFSDCSPRSLYDSRKQGKQEWGHVNIEFMNVGTTNYNAHASLPGSVNVELKDKICIITTTVTLKHATERLLHLCADDVRLPNRRIAEYIVSGILTNTCVPKIVLQVLQLTIDLETVGLNSVRQCRIMTKRKSPFGVRQICRFWLPAIRDPMTTGLPFRSIEIMLALARLRLHTSLYASSV